MSLTPGVIPDRFPLGLLEWVRVAMLILVTALVAYLWTQISEVRQTQRDLEKSQIENHEIGVGNRVVMCTALVGLNITLPPECTDPVIVSNR